MRKITYLFITILAVLCLNSCNKDDDPKLPNINVNFSATELAMGTDVKKLDEVSIELSRSASANIDVTISITEVGAIYGQYYTTSPEANNKIIKLTVPAGKATATFSISKIDNQNFTGNEFLNFTITAVEGTDAVIGNKKQLKVIFASNFVSNGGTLTLQGNTEKESHINSVYVDFSANIQKAVNRKSWNLGFYCGSEFRVMLNGGYTTAATASTKTDIKAITIDDANNAIDIAATPMSDKGLSVTAVDSYDGALTKTVFAEIAEKDEDNKVYFVVSADNKKSRDQWYKVKVTRKGAGYLVQYAKVSETEIKTIEVPKNAGYNFTFLSLETKSIVDVEPIAKNWDIAYTHWVSQAGPRPYFMNDIILINNVGGAEAVEVKITETLKYENIKLDDIKSLKFLNKRDVISSNWRVVSQMGGSKEPIGVRKDRFYVIKDPNGNYYKLRFLKAGLANDGGVRGAPEIEYALIK